MRKFHHFRTLIVSASVLALAGGIVSAQVKKGKTRLMKTSQLMKALTKPNCDAVKKGLEAGPANDEEWQRLAASAAVLNESSYILMDDDRCPDDVWANAASKILRQGSADLVAALEAKDAAAAKTAFGSMTKSCKACHEKHKPKK